MLRDLLVIAALLGVAAGVLAWFALRKHGPHNDRPLGGPNVDVSRYAWAQSEVSAAVDPRARTVLLAGSNDAVAQNRVYQSTDGGRTWDSRPGPPLPTANPCGLGDPAVAIGPDGRQYYALLVDPRCNGEHLHLYAASRAGPRDRWRTRRVEPAPRQRYLLDDKPAIAVDTWSRSPYRGRAYLAWTKWFDEADHAIAVSHTTDGRTWSPPVFIGRSENEPFPASVAVDRHGVLYVAFPEYFTSVIRIARSVDGGRSFGRVHRVARFRMRKSRVCFEGQEAGFESIPAQWKRCINPNPQLAVGRDGHILVTFSQDERNRTQGVFLLTLSPTLKVLGPALRVGPPDSMPADQFWPALTVDPSTGDIWVCYYDTTGDRRRRKTWFTCTASRDGVHWAAPARAAEDPSDESVRRADLNEYGDYEAVVAAGGVAHPFWTDSSDPLTKDEEILTATIPASRLRR